MGLRARGRSPGHARRARDRRHRERWTCGDRRGCRRGRTAALRGHRHVQREDPTIGRRGVPRRDRPAHTSSSVDARRPAYGDRGGAAAHAPAAETRSEHRHRGRSGGARALDAPGAGPRATGAVRSHRRGHRPDQAAHRPDAASRDLDAARHPRPRVSPRPVGQPVDPRPARSTPRRTGPAAPDHRTTSTRRCSRSRSPSRRC